LISKKFPKVLFSAATFFAESIFADNDTHRHLPTDANGSNGFHHQLSSQAGLPDFSW
jgi:hypothetical protein